MRDENLLKAAIKLAKAANKLADENCPEKLADIVKLHAGIAIGAAIIPIPGADSAAAAANIWTMYVRINKELDLPFSENIIKSVAAGVATNVGAAVAGLLVVGTAMKFFPGLGTLGGAAVMGATVYGLTIVAGIVYMNAVAALLAKKSASDISAEDIRAATESEMKDKEALKEMIRQAKEDHKKE